MRRARTIHRSVRPQDRGPECGGDRRETRRAGSDRLAREHVGIDHRRPSSRSRDETSDFPAAMPPVRPTEITPRWYVPGTSLAVSAGLNAYIPLILLGLAGHFIPRVDLPAGSQWLSNDWVLVLVGLIAVAALFALLWTSVRRRRRQEEAAGVPAASSRQVSIRRFAPTRPSVD